MFKRVLTIISLILFLILVFVVIYFKSDKEKFGKTIEEVGVYDTNFNPIRDQKFIVEGRKDPLRLIVGIKVKLVNKNGCPLNDGSEKMVLVMLSNQTNDFINGWKVCVPNRKIKWD